MMRFIQDNALLLTILILCLIILFLIAEIATKIGTL
jgi:hypothetical protein